MLKRAIVGILTETVLPESTHDAVRLGGVAMSKETIVALRNTELATMHEHGVKRKSSKDWLFIAIYSSSL